MTVRDGVAMPDTLVGTDSHTTMINGARRARLGRRRDRGRGRHARPADLHDRAAGRRRARSTAGFATGVTATDLVLTLTERLRKHGVVGQVRRVLRRPACRRLTLADRATISNMSPEFGATSALFPVDGETLRYLRDTGRPAELVELVERYTKEQGLFRTGDEPEPAYTETLDFDLAAVEPSLAGPRRPQDRVALARVGDSFADAFGSSASQRRRDAAATARS